VKSKKKSSLHPTGHVPISCYNVEKFDDCHILDVILFPHQPAADLTDPLKVHVGKLVFCLLFSHVSQVGDHLSSRSSSGATAGMMIDDVSI
jgi:hypothetical protein